MSEIKLKKGDKVVMHTCLESKGKNLGKVWTCHTDSFKCEAGIEVVFLEGFSGFFYTKFLQPVKLDSFCNERINSLEASLLDVSTQATKRIEELENENALFKGRNEGFEKQIMGLLIKYEEFYKRFPDLKSAMDKAEEVLKENAELKERLIKVENAYKRKSEAEWRLNDLYQKLRTDYANADKCSREYFTRYRDMEDRCIKAENIIRDLYFIIQGRIDYENNIQIKDSMDLAQAFLNEVK